MFNQDPTILYKSNIYQGYYHTIALLLQSDYLKCLNFDSAPTVPGAVYLLHETILGFSRPLPPTPNKK